MHSMCRPAAGARTSAVAPQQGHIMQASQRDDPAHQIVKDAIMYVQITLLRTQLLSV